MQLLNLAAIDTSDLIEIIIIVVVIASSVFGALAKWLIGVFGAKKAEEELRGEGMPPHTGRRFPPRPVAQAMPPIPGERPRARPATHEVPPEAPIDLPEMLRRIAEGKAPVPPRRPAAAQPERPQGTPPSAKPLPPRSRQRRPLSTTRSGPGPAPQQRPPHAQRPDWDRVSSRQGGAPPPRARQPATPVAPSLDEGRAAPYGTSAHVEHLPSERIAEEGTGRGLLPSEALTRGARGRPGKSRAVLTATPPTPSATGDATFAPEGVAGHPVSSILARLHDPGPAPLREAILLCEILGPPMALRGAPGPPV